MKRAIGFLVVAVLIGGGIWLGLATSNGARERCEWTVGVVGAMSGDWGHVGQGVLESARRAVADADDSQCDIRVVPTDTLGDPRLARDGVKQALENGPVLVIGPLFNFESRKAWPIMIGAGVPILSPAHFADPPRDRSGWFRYLPSWRVEAEALGNYVASTAPGRIVFAGTWADEQRDFVRVASQVLEEEKVEGVIWVSPDESGVEIAVRDIQRTRADTIVFVGYANQGAFVLEGLREQGSRSSFITNSLMLPDTSPVINGNRFDQFVRYSKSHSAGVVASAPWFRQEGSPVYGPETYDVVSLAMRELADFTGNPLDVGAVRAYLTERLADAHYRGAVREYSWTDGELTAVPGDIYFYRWSDQGQLNYVGHLGSG